MKKLIVYVVAVCFVLCLAGTSMASPKGKKIEYGDQKIGVVVFDGTSHNKGAKCTDCHQKPWKMKKPDKAAAPDKMAHKNCGTCHDGKKTFAIKECAKCHKK